VGGGVFMVFSGVANIAQWYPWPFAFTASHFWMAWVTMGALVAHAGAKWVITRRTFTRPSRRPPLADADPVLGTSAEIAPHVVPEGDTSAASTPAAAATVRGGDLDPHDPGLPESPTPAGGGGPTRPAGLSRRGFLGTVAGASGLLTLVTVGQTFPPLRRLAVLAPRDPTVGPQGYPVNRGAENAGVMDAARAADYRLTVTGRVSTPLSLSLDDLGAFPTQEAHLPIACVEGWSYSARWRGVRVADLLAAAGAEANRTVRLESLEANGAYRTSTLNSRQAAATDTLLATHLDGQPLALDHGYPCRLIAPNRAGVLQTKWVGSVVVE
jgi:hypothetical protein